MGAAGGTAACDGGWSGGRCQASAAGEAAGDEVMHMVADDDPLTPTRAASSSSRSNGDAANGGSDKVAPDVEAPKTATSQSNDTGLAVVVTKATTAKRSANNFRAGILGGLRSGRLEKVVADMEANGIGAEEPKPSTREVESATPISSHPEVSKVVATADMAEHGEPPAAAAQTASVKEAGGSKKVSSKKSSGGRKEAVTSCSAANVNQSADVQKAGERGGGGSGGCRCSGAVKTSLPGQSPDALGNPLNPCPIAKVTRADVEAAFPTCTQPSGKTGPQKKLSKEQQEQQDRAVKHVKAKAEKYEKLGKHLEEECQHQ